MNMSGESGPEEVKTWDLKKEYELRLEVDDEHTVVVKLIQGTAEVFGAVLVEDRKYAFKDSKFAIFTWHGCRLEIRGRCSVIYDANETPMISYINAHAALSNLRETASRKGVRGPRTMIVGPKDSGKSSLCRLLLNYAVRSSWKPMFVDVDVGQNCISIPGSLAATPIEHPIAPEASCVHFKSPLVYYYGHATPQNSPELYTKLLGRLVQDSDTRIERNNRVVQASGLIINTCGNVRDKGYETLVETAAAFEVDVILVIGYELLYSQMREDKRLSKLTVAKLAKSGGVVERDAGYRTAQCNNLIRQYFYGPRNELKPTRTEYSFTDLLIYRAGAGAAAPSSALPLGKQRLIDPNAPTLVRPSLELKNKVLGVSYASQEKELFSSNVAGFVYVQGVDIQTQTIAILAPCPGDLPSRYLILGTIQWFD